MKPPIPLHTSLSAVIGLAFLINSYSSGAAVSNPVKKSVNINHVVDVAKASKTPGNFNLVVPEAVPNRPGHREKTAHNDEKNSHHTEKAKTHADEEKHKNHLYHYNRIKRSNKKHCILLCVVVKLF